MRSTAEFDWVQSVSIRYRIGLKSYFLQVGALPGVSTQPNSPSPAPAAPPIGMIRIRIAPNRQRIAPAMLTVLTLGAERERGSNRHAYYIAPDPLPSMGVAPR